MGGDLSGEYMIPIDIYSADDVKKAESNLDAAIVQMYCHRDLHKYQFGPKAQDIDEVEGDRRAVVRAAIRLYYTSPGRFGCVQIIHHTDQTTDTTDR